MSVSNHTVAARAKALLVALVAIVAGVVIAASPASATTVGVRLDCAGIVNITHNGDDFGFVVAEVLQNGESRGTQLRFPGSSGDRIDITMRNPIDNRVEFHSVVPAGPTGCEPEPTQPATTSPVTEPPTTSPVTSAPVTTAPPSTEAPTTAAVTTTPSTQPIETDPSTTTPTTEPVTTEPVDTDPVTTEPVDTEPVDTEPVDTEPVDTEPVDTEPVDTEPTGTGPISTDPVSTEPNATDPTTTAIDAQASSTTAPGSDPLPSTGGSAAVGVAIGLMLLGFGMLLLIARRRSVVG